MLGRLSIFAICSIGRSGSTLLRNELVKSPEVRALDSDNTLRWLQMNRRRLVGRAVPRRFLLARQWRREGFAEQDIRARYARPEVSRSRDIGKVLLTKWPLFEFTRFDMPITHNLDIIALVRDPVATALSYSRPLPGHSKPFICSGVPLQTLLAPMRPFAPTLPPDEFMLAAPPHVAAAHMVRAHFTSLANDGPGRSHTVVRFEDLCADREATLTRLFDAMGVVMPRPLPSNSEFYIDAEEEGGIRMAEDTSVARASREPSPAEREEIAAIIGNAGAHFGY